MISIADPCNICKERKICRHDPECGKYADYKEYMRKMMAERRKAKKAAQEAENAGNVIDGAFTPVEDTKPSESAETPVEETVEEEKKPKKKSTALTHAQIIRKHRSDAQQKRFAQALESLPKGVSSEVTLFVAKLTQFPPIDYLHDANAIYQRFDEYVEICAANEHPPTAANFALTLGCTRQRMYQLANGKNSSTQTKEAREAINWCLSVIAGMLEQSLIENKVPTITGIYLSKANHGYSDSSVPQLTDDTDSLEGHKTAEEIRQKYADIE